MWGLARRRSQAGLAEMARSDSGVEVAVRAELAAAEDDEWVGVLIGAGGDVVEEVFARGRICGRER